MIFPRADGTQAGRQRAGNGPAIDCRKIARKIRRLGILHITNAGGSVRRVFVLLAGLAMVASACGAKAVTDPTATASGDSLAGIQIDVHETPG
jgi:hypothetical protein